MSSVEILRWRFTPETVRAFVVKNRGISGKLQTAMMPGIKRALVSYVKETVDIAFNTSPVRSRTGKLKKSLRAGVRAFGTTRLSRASVSLRGEKYGSLREFGGTVRPKNGARRLTIPLKAALKSNGEPKRKKAMDWKASHNTFIFPPRNQRRGNRRLSIAFVQGRRLVKLYSLVRQTKHPTESTRRNLGLRRNFKGRIKRLRNSMGVSMFRTYRQFDLMQEVAGKPTGR